MEGWIIFGYCLISWIVIVVFALLPKKVPVAENLCVYFCNIILITSMFSILSLNMHWIEIVDRLDFYFCRELGRNIIYPLLLLVFTNVLFTATSTALRVGTTLLTYTAICVVHFSYLLFGYFSFRHWNSWLSMLMLAFFMAAAWLFGKTFAALFRKEEAI